MARWTRKSDELQLFPTPADADAAVRDWRRALGRDVGFWLALVLYTTLAAALSVLIVMAVRRLVPLPAGPAGKAMLVFSAGPLLGLSIWYVATSFWHRRYQRFLRTRLIDLGVPVCRACGYDLRGSDSGVCSECGARA